MNREASGGPMRVFTALPLPGAALERLERAGEELRRRSRELRVVRPEGMHVTLFFFGDLEADGVSSIESAMDQPAVPGGAVDASLGGLGQFPPRGTPRVLYCPIQLGSEEIVSLHQRLRSALLAAWDSPGGHGRPAWDDPRPFTPHVTVARCRGGRLAPAVLAGLEELYSFEQPATLDRLVLFRSILKPGGAEYRPLKTVRLSEDP